MLEQEGVAVAQNVGRAQKYPTHEAALFFGAVRPGWDHSAMVFSLAATASRIILTQVSRPRAALMARS